MVFTVREGNTGEQGGYQGSGPENWFHNYRGERRCNSRIKPPAGKITGAASPDLQHGIPGEQSLQADGKPKWHQKSWAGGYYSVALGKVR